MNSPTLFQSFLNHFEELRARLIKVLAVFAVMSFFAFSWADRLIPFLTRPADRLIFTSPSEAFGVHMILTLLVGFVLSLPYTLYHVWGFAWQALTEAERKFIVIFGPLSLVFFIAGGLFAFFCVVPIAWQFLMGFATPEMVAMITVKNYIDFIGTLIISFGVMFELPLVLAFLTKIGIASPAFLSHYRRHAIVLIFILSAILTPPDVISQILMAVPMVMLYELGVLFSRLNYKQK